MMRFIMPGVTFEDTTFKNARPHGASMVRLRRRIARNMKISRVNKNQRRLHLDNRHNVLIEGCEIVIKRRSDCPKSTTERM
jgi:polygalacturonase